MTFSPSFNKACRTLFQIFTASRVRGAAIALLAAALPFTASEAVAGTADAQFSALYNAWTKLDGPSASVDAGTAAIPSRKPVESVRLTSDFGVRNDPFNGRHRMHQGIDIPGPIGTPIYATADGIVSRAEWAGGYGNLVEIDHGNGLTTRYAHLNAFDVKADQIVPPGAIIGRLGSTGRSTGPHLHYETRLNGEAGNPLRFIEAGARLSRPTVGGGEKP